MTFEQAWRAVRAEDLHVVIHILFLVMFLIQQRRLNNLCKVILEVGKQGVIHQNQSLEFAESNIKINEIVLARLNRLDQEIVGPLKVEREANS